MRLSCKTGHWPDGNIHSKIGNVTDEKYDKRNDDIGYESDKRNDASGGGSDGKSELMQAHSRTHK